MKAKVFCLAIILFLIPVAFSLDESPTTLLFVNAYTNMPVEDCPLQVIIDERVYRLMAENGTLKLNLENETEHIEVICSLPDTPAADHYGQMEGRRGEENTFCLHPIATVKGVVLDNAQNVVSNAQLHFDCDDTAPETTDDFGNFLTHVLPAGKCRIAARYKNAIGFADIETAPGEMKEVEIVLDKSIVDASEKRGVWPLLGGMLFVVALVITAVLLTQKVKTMEKKVSHEERKAESIERKTEEKEKKEYSKRTKDVLATLNEKEKEVIELLLESKNKATQGHIRNETGIPKTTLARMFLGLEAKNVITIEKVGKLKKVKLTPWFLGKE